jgi:hypothetical protein
MLSLNNPSPVIQQRQILVLGLLPTQIMLSLNNPSPVIQQPQVLVLELLPTLTMLRQTGELALCNS